MTLYVLDWSGTLDQLSSPKGFVRALQSLGHKVVIFSALGSNRNPAWDAADSRFDKNWYDVAKVILSCREEWPGITKVIVSDDDAYYRENALAVATDPKFDLPMETILPRELNAHLTSLAGK